jgi:hypothetical protein
MSADTETREPSGNGAARAATPEPCPTPAHDSENDEGTGARVTPGEYSALYLRHVRMEYRRSVRVRVDFQLLAHPGLTVSRYYPVDSCRGGLIRAKACSDLVRELQVVAGHHLRGDRIYLAGILKGVQLQVLVVDVVKDADNQPLSEVNIYSKVRKIVGRA